MLTHHELHLCACAPVNLLTRDASTRGSYVLHIFTHAQQIGRDQLDLHDEEDEAWRINW